MAPDNGRTPSRLQPFTLADWLVDPKACHLSRGDQVVKLRPQLVDVLVCLAMHAGDIVLKDEILAEVWPGQFIAESGLSRCIAELRQILGDDAQQPRYIETITKRGYRLVAPVVWMAPPVHERVADREAPIEPAVDTVQPGDVSARDAGPATEDSGSRTEDSTRGAQNSNRRWHRAAWAAGALAIAAAGTVIGLLTVRSPASVLTERDTVLLADVRNTTRDSVFDDTLRLALAVNLEQAPFLHILPEDVMRAAVVRAGRPPETRVVGPIALDVCRREGAAVLLAGSISLLGTRYAIGIEAIACGSGDAIARTLVETDRKDQVLGTLEQAATRIREKLGESRESLRQHDVPLERATTPSLDALKALTLGDRNRDQARLPEAMMLYRQATDLDPDFALAWARRGAVARNLGLRAEMQPAFQRAYDLRDRVSRPERFYIEAHYVFETDPEKAIEIYRAWKRMYPGSVIPPNNLAALLSGLLGQYDAALTEAREAVRLAPGSSIAHRNLVTASLGAGRPAEAHQALENAARRGIDDPIIGRLRLKMAFFDGDAAGVDREIQGAAADPAQTFLTLQMRASAAMTAGRLREARRLWTEALEAPSDVARQSRVGTRLYQAEAEALLGDARLAREAASAALALDNQPITMEGAAVVFALTGDAVRASRLLRDIAGRREQMPFALTAVLVPSGLALVESVQGHADRAIDIFQPVTRFARGSDHRLVPLGRGALIALRAGRPAEAAAAFRDLIQLRGIEPATPWVAFARLGLARALRQANDTAGSLAAYDAFLDSWKEADPDAPLLAIARRERADLAAR